MIVSGSVRSPGLAAPELEHRTKDPLEHSVLCAQIVGIRSWWLSAFSIAFMR
jgi:hypothetical protein